LLEIVFSMDYGPSSMDFFPFFLFPFTFYL
jgi:hypothetical protein